MCKILRYLILFCPNQLVYVNILYMKLIEKWQNLSRKKKAYLSAFVTIIAIMMWAFVSAGIITHNFNRSQLQTSSDRQEALIKGIILTETKNEKKYWEIYGETGTYDSNNGVAILNSVIGNFYDENNEVSMSFESSRGTYNSKKSEIILYNDTHIVLKDGISLKADFLKWAGSNNPIVARGHIVVQKGNEMLATSEQITISPTFDSFKITGNTVSKIYDVKEKK